MISKNITMFAFVLVLFSLMSTSVLGLGVSPSSVNLVEGDEYFLLTIHNNERINIGVSLSVVGDDFLELEEDSFFLSAEDERKTIKVFVKEKDYRIDKRAAIKIFENRQGDSMISVNLGIESSVSLMVPSDEAFLEASIITSTNIVDGRGYYLVRLDNKGRGATTGEVLLELGDYEETKTFSIEGLRRKDVSFRNEEELSLGSHEARSKIVYDDEDLIVTRTFQVGKPFVKIKELIPIDYSNEALFLEALINSEWPEPITSEITAIANEEEFVSRTYTLINEQKKIPLTINILENEETILTLTTNNQEPEQFTVLVKDRVVYINEEPHYLKEDISTISLTTIIIIFSIILLIVLLLFLKGRRKNKTKYKKTSNKKRNN